MERWVLYALISMLFAGCTSVVAKLGLADISAELGLFVRTLFVCLFTVIFSLWIIPLEELNTLKRINVGWLALSAITTTASWIFYYKALKVGDVATVALIDKGSVVVAIALAWLFLKEVITPRIALGLLLIVSGLLVMIKKPS